MIGIEDDNNLLDILESLAVRAGEEILSVRAKGIIVSEKADNSPVTEADNRAEQVILAGLAQSFPDVPVVAEESAAAGIIPDVSSGPFFLVDPLDGTKEFINGRLDFTVNIALVVNGMPLAGVVYAPAHGTIYSGSMEGAQKAEVLAGGRQVNRKAISGSTLAAKPRIVASKSHNTPETDEFIKRFSNHERVYVGSSLKFCLLAEGAADLYPRFGRTMEWDTAAGDAVLRAAGGKTLVLDSSPLRYGKRDQANDSDFANPHFICVTSQAEKLIFDSRNSCE